MPALTCPLPGNIDALTTNGFLFSIQKYPEITYFCQSVSLPQINLGASLQATAVHDLKIPGDTMEFDDLQIEFIVDSEMKNYMAIYEWMAGLGFPEGRNQFREFINSPRNAINTSTRGKMVSDAQLTILDANNSPVKRFMIHDAFPTSLSAINFQSVNNDVNYVVASLTMAYSLYTPE